MSRLIACETGKRVPDSGVLTQPRLGARCCVPGCGLPGQLDVSDFIEAHTVEAIVGRTEDPPPIREVT